MGIPKPITEQEKLEALKILLSIDPLKIIK